MKVVLLRHGTRASQDFGDSPLSPVGHKQAEDLAERVQSLSDLPRPTLLLCSPKRRARETLQPLSDSAQLGMELALTIDARIDERHQAETGREFESRLKEVLDEVSNKSEDCIYICSHLDWLELAMVLIPSNMSELEKALSWSTAEYRIFKVEHGLWNFKLRGSIAPRGR
jgi:broad specificity phosphatase PhoE